MLLFFGLVLVLLGVGLVWGWGGLGLALLTVGALVGLVGLAGVIVEARHMLGGRRGR